jgi:hypothetical protein
MKEIEELNSWNATRRCCGLINNTREHFKAKVEKRMENYYVRNLIF